MDRSAGSGSRSRGRLRVGVVTYGLDRPLSGIGRYAVELARALSALDEPPDVTLLNPSSRSPAGLELIYPVARLRGRLLPSLMLTGPAQLAFAARHYDLNVIHDPIGVSPFLVPRSLGRFRRIVTLHDMIPFVHPETHARLTNLLFHHYIPLTLPFVDHVITDSEASKRDIQHFFRVEEERISVIPCGVSPSFQPTPVPIIDKVLHHYGILAPYILTVGALQARKNLETLFEAYRILKARGLPHQLVVVGSKVWKTSGLFQRLDSLGLGQAVTLTGYVPDEDLPSLYGGADVFVFPSLYEGFGLPPLEAMACDTPVVVSNASSLPEVVGDAGLLVDPLNVKGFADAIERIITDESLSQSLRLHGIERAQRFTWTQAAQLHLNLYLRLASDCE